VIEGQGVALGWRHLTERLVASGILVRVSDHIMTTGKGFHVAWPKSRALSDNARRVRDWLVAQA
jgi:DNA-binding transcriptional LysR family regulator